MDTWDEFLDFAARLIVDNTFDTLGDERDMDDGQHPGWSVHMAAEAELRQMVDNLLEDIDKRWDDIMEKVKETLDKEGIPYLE